MALYTNQGVSIAVYEGVEVTAESSVTVDVPEIAILKTADQTVWVRDELTFTVRIANIETGGSTATNVRFTDTINTALATLVLDSVTINGTPAVEGTDFTYVPATGLLTVPLENLDPGESHEVTFRIRKVIA